MARQFSNNASSTLAASIVPADTTILIQGSDAAEFPTLSGGNTFDITIHEGATIEIASCTARTGATLTVVRGQQGTSAGSFTTNAIVEHRLTAGALTNWETVITNHPLTAGSIVFAGTSGELAQDNTHLQYDNTNDVLKLGVGSTMGALAADFVKVGVVDTDGAGSAGAQMLTEGGHLYSVGGATTNADINVTPAAGVALRLGTTSTAPVEVRVNSATKLTVAEALVTNDVATRFSSNVGIGTSTFGTDAALVLSQAVGTPPTSAPASQTQIWTDDRNGADTATLFFRGEDSGINERLVAVTVQAFDGTERTTVSTSTVDLSTLTVNIPPTDAFIVTGLYRKSAGAAATVSLGLKVNGTQIINNFAVTNADNEAQMGQFSFGQSTSGFGAGRAPGYTQSAGFHAQYEAAGTALASLSSVTYANQLPTAAITSIAITGLVANALNTLGIINVTVYRIARS